MRPRLSGPSLVAGRYRLHSRVEERVERFSRFTGDGAFFTEVELVEECLVGDTPQRVIDAHVQLVAVLGQCETVIKVGTCQFVLHVTGFDLCFEEREPSADAILLRLEQIERHRSCIVGLQKFGTLCLEIVAF
ncbi:hypothetical protein [Agrococcus casei]|uniref:hypothetical protein n=1 Tax=Agrococcus casei TaxID=343512 RepID=UPI001F2B202C|nr:hypothetical protein [Agrococcus casei]